MILLGASIKLASTSMPVRARGAVKRQGGEKGKCNGSDSDKMCWERVVASMYAKEEGERETTNTN